MAYQRSVGELAAIYVIVTICLCFLAWIGTALYRWSNEPYRAPKPSSLEVAIEACKARGGVPYTKWTKMDGYSPEEILDRCDEKPAQQ